jgi:hypothetical protein
VASNNPAYTSIGGVLFNKSATTLLQFPGGVVGSYSIPDSVTDIESNAFADCSVTTIIIPNSVSSIGDGAFEGTALSSVTILDGVTNIGEYAFYDSASLTNVVLGNNLISIGAYAFSGPNWQGPTESGCPLTSITVPANVTNIGEGAFEGCGDLRSAYFLGNAPDADSTVFESGPFFPGEDPLSAYYLPGTTGWAEFTTNTGVPTALWTLPNPLILNDSFGVLNNQFGFTISWATNVSVVVEASTDLSNPVWIPLSTNTLSGGTSSFSDPQWTSYPARFYRLRAQ